MSHKVLTILACALLLTACKSTNDKNEMEIGKQVDFKLDTGTMTPEALWAMGSIGSYAVSPDSLCIAYQVTYYSVEQNKSHTVLYVIDYNEGIEPKLITTSDKSESDPAWLADGRLAFLCEGEVWTMSSSGKNRKQLTHTDGAVDGFLFAPDGKKVILK